MIKSNKNFRRNIIAIFSPPQTRKQTTFNKAFVHFASNENDESMLYMVDYDEVSIQHGKLQLTVPHDGYEDNSLI